MTSEELKSHISSHVPETEFVEENVEFLTAVVPGDKVLDLLKPLRENEETNFDFLFCQTCIDWPEHFDVVYHLTSTTYHHDIVVKARITDKENPAVNTVSDIWKTAEFHEREIYDLFGINFYYHPDLRRIFLEDDWKGHPLRKDYVDKINIVEL